MRLVLVAQFRDESNVGMSLEHVGQFFNLMPGSFVQNAAFAGSRPAALLLASEIAQIAPGRDHDRIKQPRFNQSARSQLLKADSEGKHGHERCHSYGNADGRQRISQYRFAKVSHGEFGQVVNFHGRSPFNPEAAGMAAGLKSARSLIRSSTMRSSTSFPSARKIMRCAYCSARARSCVTITTVIPNF